MITIIFFCLVLVLAYVLHSVTKPSNYPPGPAWLPIVGNIPLLKRLIKKYRLHHIVYAKLAEKYNTNILGLRLGNENVIVVFKYHLFKQILSGESYNARPKSFFIKLRCLGKRKGITGMDGEIWSSNRNFLVRHLRNVGFGKSPMEKMIQEELNEIKLTISQTDSDLYIHRLITPSVLSILWGLTAGRRLSRNDDQLSKLLDLFYRRNKAFDMSGGVLSQFPFLRLIAPEWSGYNIITEINKEVQDFIINEISSHYETWTEGRDDDVIHAFITEMKNNPESKIFTVDQLMMICMDVIIAGSETTGNTVEYLFLLMILYPEIQAKVQEVLDKEFKTDEEIKYSDKHKVPYVEAVLNEGYRFCHVVPIIGPRRVLQETMLDGYRIPKDATILASAYSVHNNPDTWGDPETFRPERFLDNNGKHISNEKLLPFGLGKRRCLGETLARSCIFVFFTGILRNYTILKSPHEPTPTLESMPGITLSPKRYKVSFQKRT